MRLCSACLLGVKCRWDGDSRPNKKVINLLKKEILIPICPEQLGGLTTPRESAEQLKNKVFTKSGKDVTKNFKKGAEEVLKLAKKQYKKEDKVLSGQKYLTYLTALGMVCTALQGKSAGISPAYRPTKNLILKAVNRFKEVYQEYF